MAMSYLLGSGKAMLLGVVRSLGGFARHTHDPALENARLRAALEEIKGKYAWQTEAGAIARKALTPDEKD